MAKQKSFPRVPSFVPEPLRQTYLRTEIIVDQDGKELDPLSAVERYGSPLFVVTACNPVGTRLSDDENGERMDSLYDELNDSDITWAPAVGGDPTSSWAEPSAAIVGANLKTARRVGRRHGQLAIFELTDAAVTVRGCFSRWSRSRPHDEAQDGCGDGDTLGEAVNRTFGSAVARELKRFRHPGWDHLGVTELACRGCAGPTELFSVVHMERSGRIVEHLATVCPRCRTAEPTTKLSSNKREMIERWRDFLLAQADAAESGIGSGAGSSYRCYVVGLDRADEKWVYVGQTSKEPEERLREHLSGIRSTRAVREHGTGLRVDLMEHLPMFADQMSALTYEAYLGARLTADGYTVEGGH